MVSRNITLKVPRLPNFIRTDIDGHTIPVTELSDKEIDALGAAWVAEMKTHRDHKTILQKKERQYQEMEAKRLAGFANRNPQ